MASLMKYLKSKLTSLHKEDHKMAIVVRTDIPMGRGKIAAQCAHAALECYRQASASKKDQVVLNSWLRVGQPKVVLKIPSERELLTLAHNAQLAGLVTVVIKDAGRTQLQPGMISVLGIGPASKLEVDNLTSNLKLL